MKRREKELSARFCEKNRVAVISNGELQVQIGFTKEPADELRERIKRYYLPEKTVEFQKISEEEFLNLCNI